jgi:hypothetical protein
MPEVAGGEHGWIVYSPPRQESIYSTKEDRSNQGLWFSPDAESWADVDDLGPLADSPVRSMVVRDDHILVFAGVDRGPGRGWGVPSDPVTEVWRFDLTVPASPAGSKVTVELDAIEGVDGLSLAAWLLPEDPAEGFLPLGGTHWFGSPPQIDEFVPGTGRILQKRYTASDVIHPMRRFVSRTVAGGTVPVESGNYRLVFEAREYSDWAARYGCEIPIEVVHGEALVVTVTDLPDFREDGERWAPRGEWHYPDCSD